MEKQVILVTGASSGFGALTARELAMADALRGCQMLPQDWNIGSSIARDEAAGAGVHGRPGIGVREVAGDADRRLHR